MDKADWRPLRCRPVLSSKWNGLAAFHGYWGARTLLISINHYKCFAPSNPVLPMVPAPAAARPAGQACCLLPALSEASLTPSRACRRQPSPAGPAYDHLLQRSLPRPLLTCRLLAFDHPPLPRALLRRGLRLCHGPQLPVLTRLVQRRTPPSILQQLGCAGHGLECGVGILCLQAQAGCGRALGTAGTKAAWQRHALGA